MRSALALMLALGGCAALSDEISERTGTTLAERCSSYKAVAMLATVAGLPVPAVAQAALDTICARPEATVEELDALEAVAE